MPKFSITSFNLQPAIPSNFQPVIAMVSNDPTNPGAIQRSYMGAVNMPAGSLNPPLEIGSGSPSSPSTPSFYLEVATSFPNLNSFVLFWDSVINNNTITYSVKCYAWLNGWVVTLWTGTPVDVSQSSTYAQNFSLKVDNNGFLTIAPA